MKSDRSALRKFDDLLAEKVMGWTLENGSWWLMGSEGKLWRAGRLWKPTVEAAAAELVWIRCLLKARDFRQGLTVTLDDHGRFVVGTLIFSTTVKDPSWNLAVCRCACRLFDLQAPEPYNRNPGEA